MDRSPRSSLCLELASTSYRALLAALLPAAWGCGQSTQPRSCDVYAPVRQLAPSSTALVTSQRPTLRWTLSNCMTRASGARVDLCRDRAMATGCSSFTAQGSSAPAPQSLTPGVWYWRLQGLDGATPRGAPSPVWQFTVGPRSATAADTSHTTTLDVNGDGFADVAIGANQQGAQLEGAVHLFRGSAQGLAQSPSQSLLGLAGPEQQFGVVVTGAGDVNGDGFGDLLVSALNAASDSAQLLLLAGSASGLREVPLSRVRAPGAGSTNFARRRPAVADFNGDGFADALVGDPYYGNYRGRAYLYLGSEEGLGASPALTFDNPRGEDSYFGEWVANAGDLDGDGLPEMLLSATYTGSQDTGRFYLLRGAAQLGSTLLELQTRGLFGAGRLSLDATPLGDVDGDGYADLALVNVDFDTQRATAVVLRGGAGGLPGTPGGANTPSARLVVPAALQGTLLVGGRSNALGDVDGDGFADFSVVALASPGASAELWVYRGSAQGVLTEPAARVPDPSGFPESLGFALAGVGDVDGDLRADVVLGSWQQEDGSGAAWFYAGSPRGLGASPSFRFPSPAGQGAHFGGSVALRPERRPPGGLREARAPRLARQREL